MEKNSGNTTEGYIPSDPGDIINQIYDEWQYIGKDENGNDYRLPLKKKVIDKSRALLARLDAGGHGDDNIGAHINYIRKVLKNAMKRKMIISWKFIIIVLAFLGFWVWQSHIYKPAGYWVTDLSPADLEAKQKKEVAMLSRNIDSYINTEIPDTEAKIKSLKDSENAESYTDDIKKSEEWLKSLHELLEEDRSKLDQIKDITPEQYRELTIKNARKENASIIGGLVIWGIALVLYFISQRRPYFMFWRKSYNNGNLTNIDDAGTAFVTASLMDSLVNFDSNSTQYVKWSDGTVTRETDLTRVE
ncbi:MAG: hypothetical protein R2744_03415 [Bacteroidales bacterium]